MLLFMAAVASLMVPAHCFALASSGTSIISRSAAPMMADVGAASTAFYTDQVRKDSYDKLDYTFLSQKVADADMRRLMLTLFDSFATIADALSKELVRSLSAESKRSTAGGGAHGGAGGRTVGAGGAKRLLTLHLRAVLGLSQPLKGLAPLFRVILHLRPQRFDPFVRVDRNLAR